MNSKKVDGKPFCVTMLTLMANDAASGEFFKAAVMKP